MEQFTSILNPPPPPPGLRLPMSAPVAWEVTDARCPQARQVRWAGAASAHLSPAAAGALTGDSVGEAWQATDADGTPLARRVRFHRPYAYPLEPDTAAGAEVVVRQAPFDAEGFASTGALGVSVGQNSRRGVRAWFGPRPKRGRESARCAGGAAWYPHTTLLAVRRRKWLIRNCCRGQWRQQRSQLPRA